MKRKIAFLLIITLVLGLFAGCKRNEDDFSVSGSYAENEQVIGGNEDSDETDNGSKEETPTPGTSQDKEDDSSQNQQNQKPQQTPSEPEQENSDSAKDEEQEPEQEKEQEEEAPVGEGGGPLYNASENPYKDSLKILAFGNSFSKDAMQHLWDIAKDYGVKTVILGNLNIGGCSLKQHYENMNQNAAVYAYTKNTSGTWETSKNFTAEAGLADEDWDIITIQQASDQNADPGTYNQLGDILNYLERKKPSKDTKILWHMTWAYQSDSKKAAFEKYGYNQIKMYEALLKRAKNEVLFYDNFAGVIPVGTAIQNVRKTSVGDTLTRDGYHLSYGMGRYIAALTWYCYITGADPEDTEYAPTEDQAEIYLHHDEIKKAVADAIRNPYEIT